MPKLSLFSSSSRQALLVAAIVILSSFSVGLARLAWTDYGLRALEAEERARVEALQNAIKQLDQDIARAKTDDFVREWARTVAKQTLAGEVPVVLVVPPQAPPVAPIAAPAAKPAPSTATPGEGMPRWRVLLERFFPPARP